MFVAAGWKETEGSWQSVQGLRNTRSC